ncbi:Ig-like domain-containing protein [Spirosoma foliorum]|uniref:Ig-like domain-containing protein n=1 Tax=Spirosoma foliorum TaxID=2710596 RepID=A0A7G5GVY4_9BACT|nr:hypothetical protein [Spirosoma foliorum]QMW03026.1 hypothetical protein H3H32_34955 [Spirosoma foliorum]
MTVISRPVPPTVSSTILTYCQYDSPAPLSATAIIGNTLNWYGTNETGGVASLSATIPSTNTPGSTRYYVSQSDGNGCESSTRAFISVTVNAKPVAPTTNSIILCQNANSVSLQTGVTSGSNLKWYNAQTGGTLYTGTPALSTSAVGVTTYYVSQTSNGCESDRSAVVVTIKALPVAPTVTPNPQLLCQSSVPSSLTATTSTGGTLNWYTIQTGGNPSSVAPIPSTSNVGPQTYYVSQTVDGCEGPRAALNIVVIAKPAIPTVVSPMAACQLSTPVTLAATGTNLKWYADPSTTTTIPTPTPPTTTPGTTAYYVSQTDANGCESGRASITVIINASPNATLVSSGTLTCAITSVTLTAGTGVGYSFSGPGIASQNPISGTAVVTAAGVYSVTITNANGCAAMQTTSVQSNTTVPVATLTQNGPLTPGTPSATLTAGGGSLYAFSGPGLVSQNSIAGTAVANVSGTYSVTVTTANGCFSTASVALAGTDLTPIIIMPQANFPAAGSVVDFLVRVSEVSGLPTSMGNVTIVITAPVGYMILFNQFISNIDVSGGNVNVPVNNVNWNTTADLAGRQLSLTMKAGQFIEAGGASILGVSIIRTTASSGSISNISVAVQNDISKEYDGVLSNNVYARVINGL